GADAVIVRDGPLTLPSNSFVGGAAFPNVNPFYELISFTTPFTYNGGTLSITIRHKENGAGSNVSRFLEAPNGTTNDYKAFAAPGADATMGSFSVMEVVRINVLPEPTCIALIVFGLMPAMRLSKIGLKRSNAVPRLNHHS